MVQQELIARHVVAGDLYACRFFEDKNKVNRLEIEEQMRTHSIGAYREILRFVDDELEKLEFEEEREEHNHQFR